MANEYKLSYTGSEINEKLAKIDELDTKSTATNLVNGSATGALAGVGSSATQQYAFAEGFGNTASGYFSHAEGNKTNASGGSSHAEGYNVTASGSNQHAQGKYNIADTVSAHIVGNGTANTPSNAHTLDWEGNAWFAGDVYVGSTGGINRDDGSRKLATVADLEDAIATIPTPDVSGQISQHNTDTSAHSDIRDVANYASRMANNAQSNVNSMSKTIDEVLDTANVALSQAKAAQITASTAEMKANSAQSAADSKAPMYTYGTEDLTAGSSPLETGKLHFVYE